MTLVIDRVEAPSPDLADFLIAHHSDMAGTAPPESQHALPLDRLLAPGVRLFAGRDDGELVATGALAPLGAMHEELKSMRTDPARRGQGLGRRMLDALLADAASRGIERVSLETGSDDFFRPAHVLYERAGFRDCPPFGSYAPDPHSRFMTRILAVDQERAGSRR